MTSAAFVLLGVPDEPIYAAGHAVDFTSSKCGGRCDLPPPFRRELLENDLRCGCCGGGGGGASDTGPDDSDHDNRYSRCQSSMKLVCQIYCPLTGSRYHRTLYFFACANRRCWNNPASWRVIRAQALCQTDDPIVEDEVKGKNELFDLDDDWGDDADDWYGSVNVDHSQETVNRSSNPVAAPTTTPMAQQRLVESSDDDDGTDSISSKSSAADADEVMEAESVHNVVVDTDEQERLISRLRDGDSSSAFAPKSSSDSSMSFSHFDPFFVACVEEEIGSRSSLDSHVQKLLKDYKQLEGDPEGEEFLDQFENLGRNSSSSARGRDSAAAGSSASTVTEKYEKGIPKHGYQLFQNFIEVLSSFPSQILRYSWSGYPLLMTPPLRTPNGDRDFVCTYCGAKKVFEMQLLPTLVNYLKCRRLDLEGVTDGCGNTILDHSVTGEALIDFGTVMVFSCEKSCWNNADPRLIQETIVLQEEPGSEFSRGK